MAYYGRSPEGAGHTRGAAWHDPSDETGKEVPVVSIVDPGSDSKVGGRRKAVPKRVRFEVLRRDDYTCRYCHATDTPLTIDHVVPNVLGGTDDPSNLVAACVDCNNGKTSSSPTEAMVAQVTEDALRWSAAMQVAAGLMRDSFEEEWSYAEALDREWSRWSYGVDNRLVPRPGDWRNSANSWRVAGLPVDLLTDSARRALGNSKIHPDVTWKYFCGIAWKRITKIQEDAKASLAEPDDEDDTQCVGQHPCDCQATAFYQGRADAAERLHLRYSHTQFQALMEVTDAEGMRWVASL